MVMEMAFHVNLSGVVTEPNKGRQADTEPRGAHSVALSCGSLAAWSGAAQPFRWAARCKLGCRELSGRAHGADQMEGKGAAIRRTSR